jgi:hypothetical protein
LEFFHGILHLRILICLNGEYPCIDIRSDFLESFDWILVFGDSGVYCIPYSRFYDRLETRDNISDFSFIEDSCWRIFWSKASYLESLYLGSSIDKFELVSFFYFS